MSTTREQEIVCERLALESGRVYVREGYSNGVVTMTTPTGKELRVSYDGHVMREGQDFSVSWAR